MRILHGENIVQSRNSLVALVVAAKEAGKQVQSINAKSLDLPVMEQLLGSENLFAEPQLLVIEELHSLPKSKKKDALIEMLGNFAGAGASGESGAESTAVILWEKRELTPTMLKKFPGGRADLFKLSSALFSWLDSFGGDKNHQLQLLAKALASDGDFMCFSMLARQIRMLIQAKEGNLVGAPFMIAKLKSQCRNFSLEELLQVHRQLLLIDLGQKTSSSRLSLSQELELLVVGL
jgi:DNA polymerase III delta subunit